MAIFSLHLAMPRGLGFDAAIQPGDAEAVRGPGYLREAGVAHQFNHLGRRRKTLHRGRQVGIGAADTRQARADGGQHAAEIKGIKLSDESARFAEVKNSKLASGAEHTVKFTQAGFVVGQVAKSKGAGDEVERVRGERKMERVSLDRNNVAVLKFSRAAYQHGMRKIGSEDGLRACGTVAE